MMMDWQKFRATVKDSSATSAGSLRSRLRGMQSIAASCETTAHLDSKARELIALRVAVTARCYGCIGLHVEAAPKLGASQKELPTLSASRSGSMPATRWPIHRVCWIATKT